jgi:DNA-directed RNA polymerase subunit RPC12/RpoP
MATKAEMKEQRSRFWARKIYTMSHTIKCWCCGQERHMTREIDFSGKCSLCGEVYTGFGNNPEPLKKYEERCCDTCNSRLVIPARINFIEERRNEQKGH